LKDFVENCLSILNQQNKNQRLLPQKTRIYIMAKQKTTTSGAKKTSKPSVSTAKKTNAKSTAKASATPDTKFSSWDAIIKEISSIIERNMNWFIQADEISRRLTGRDRLRLISARSRNYGFIDKAFDIARDNPNFMPPNFDTAKLYENIRELEDLRQLMLLLQQFLQLVTSSFMQQADLCYRNALRIYNSLQEQTRAGVPGSGELFEALRDFFHRRRRHTDEPTEKELERDIKRLLHGTADGEIIIENVSPKVTGGVHRIVDNVHKGKTAYKETDEAVIDEGVTSRK
jgi:hypothetical protein